jgi:hypothetical protein
MNEKCLICDQEFEKYTMNGLRRGALCLNTKPFTHMVDCEWWMVSLGGIPFFRRTYTRVSFDNENISILYCDGEYTHFSYLEDGKMIPVKDVEIYDWKELPKIIKLVKQNSAFL